MPLLNDISGHWAKDYINTLYNDYIINGYPDGSFKPNFNITRAEMAVALVKALGMTPETNPNLSFTDNGKIPGWAACSIATLVKQQIINGYNDGTFRPNDKIKRQEIAVMIMKAKKLDVSDMGETNFEDNASIPSWAMKYVAKAVDLGIINGVKVGNVYYFKPANNATRAEVCVIVTKM